MLDVSQCLKCVISYATFLGVSLFIAMLTCLLLSNFSASGLACGLMVSLPAYTYKFAGLIPYVLTDVASTHLTNYLSSRVLPAPRKGLFRFSYMLFMKWAQVSV